MSSLLGKLLGCGCLNENEFSFWLGFSSNASSVMLAKMGKGIMNTRVSFA